MEIPDLSALQERIGYRFGSLDRLQEALRHRSFVNEQADPLLENNERLEFLGDAVLNLVIGHLLMERYPDRTEGDLSRMRANLVNEQRLAAVAEFLSLGDCVQLGKGERQSQGRRKRSILADTFEALVAAVYLDGGFAAVFDMLQDLFQDHLETIQTRNADRDYKSRLQEMIQSSAHAVPVYRLITASGPDHAKTFEVELEIDALTARGRGSSKKAAEQAAAKAALLQLEDGNAP